MPRGLVNTGNHVVKLDQAIFTLQVYQSEFGGRVQEIHDFLSGVGRGFFAFGAGAVPSDSAFAAIEPHDAIDLVTALLGYGVPGVPGLGREGFYLRRFLNEPPVFFRTPLEGTARERMSPHALSQKAPRQRGVFKPSEFSRKSDPIHTRTQPIL